MIRVSVSFRVKGLGFRVRVMVWVRVWGYG